MKTKKKRTKAYELLVVEDFTEYNEALARGEMSQEDYDVLFGRESREHGLMNTPEGKAFGKIYPFAVGGSDTAAIRGISPWTSRRMLQLLKTKALSKTVLPSTQFIYDFGHIFETAVGTMGALQLRHKGHENYVYVPCDFGYVNTRWPHFLAHPDGFIMDKKTREIVALAEVKTSFTKMHEVPEYYICQVQAYMQVLGLDKCYVLAWNGIRDEDGFSQHLIERDEALAVSILDDCEKFVADTVAGIEYDDEPLPSELALMFNEVDETEGFIKLPRKVQGTLEEYDRLEKDKQALREEIKDTTALINKITAEQSDLKNKLYPYIGKAPGGTLETSKAIFNVSVTREFSFDKDVKKVIAEKHPEVWEELIKLKPTIKATIKPIAKDLGEGEQLPDNVAAV